MEEITSRNLTPPDITGTAFNGVDKENCNLNVPIGSFNLYWVHSYWGKFFNINEVDGIDAVTPDEQDKEISWYYTIDGRQVNAPVKGVNIVRYIDGTTKKVLVK